MQPQRNKSEKKNQNEKNQWTKKIREREGENIVNVTTQPNLLYIVRFGPYRPHGFVPSDASLLLSPTSQNTYDKLAPTLLIRPTTILSPVDVRYYTTDLW